jgi:hypothetical protein
MPKAVTAFARRLGCLIYHLVRWRKPFDPALVAQQQERHERAKENRLRKEAEKRGYELVPKRIAATPASA